MNTNTNDFDYDLKGSGLKVTKHRTAILEILGQNDQPLAAEDVFIELKKRNLSVNLSTVYRTLEVLSEKELVTKLSLSGDDRMLFEYNSMVHKHYLVCLNCKKIQAIDHCPLEEYEKSIEKETNYSITGHKLDIYGYCPDCMGRDKQKE